MIEHTIAQEVQRIGGRCFYVGGYVRDSILGVEAHDIDIECFDITLEQLKEIIQKRSPIKEVGKQFGVIKLLNYPHIDFALPRIEIATGKKHTDFSVHFLNGKNYKKAASRRDFTINALMQDVLTGELLDYFNGLNDLRSKQIRYIQAETFIEDALRGLRAAQFAARFNFKIETRTISLIEQLSYQHLSKERIISEFKKGIMSQSPAYFIQLLSQLKITPKLFPELIAIDMSQFQLTAGTKGYKRLNYTQRLSILLLCLPHTDDTLILKITNKKQQQESIQNHIAVTRFLQQASSPTELREIKFLSKNIEELWEILKVLYDTYAFSFTTYSSYNYFMDSYQLANNNNPSNIPLIQGKDLIRLGYHPAENFKTMLTFAKQLELEGYTKEDIEIDILNTFK